MKTFKEFLNESSLSRIKSKSDKGGMAVISGSRGDKSKKENKARAKQLDRDIKGKGLPGATKVSLEDGMRRMIRLVKPQRLKNVVTLSLLVRRVRESLRKQ